MNTVHVVTGAGPVGTTVATHLALAGHRVRLLTRSGSGPDHPAIERRRVDLSATDPGHWTPPATAPSPSTTASTPPAMRQPPGAPSSRPPNST